jgi:hypothetical protein
LTRRAAVYPGEYATCAYDPTKALCHTKAGTGDHAPDLTSCKPLTCRNVSLDENNIDAWRKELDSLTTDLAVRGGSPTTRRVILPTKAAVRSAIAAIAAEDDRPPLLWLVASG